MRLNGWQRIGIVLSILWFLVGSFWFYTQLWGYALAPVNSQYQTCLESRFVQPNETVRADTGPCEAAFHAQWAAATDHWYGLWAMITALIITAIAWLLVYAMLYTVRCNKVGFK